jgi:hypothetical protein
MIVHDHCSEEAAWTKRRFPQIEWPIGWLKLCDNEHDVHQQDADPITVRRVM